MIITKAQEELIMKYLENGKTLIDNGEVHRLLDALYDASVFSLDEDDEATKDTYIIEKLHNEIMTANG